MFDFDLFVLGAGSGGVRLGRTAASLGARVAMAEASRPGGTCVLRGCVPKKLLVYASRFPKEVRDSHGFGWRSGGAAAFSWDELRDAKDREVARLSAIYAELLRNSGVELLHHRATVCGPHTVSCGGRTITAGHIVVATGAKPDLPRVPGVELAITSNEAMDLARLPGRVGIIGGGYIALEFAGIFNGLGSRVDLLLRSGQPLRSFDADVRHEVAAGVQRAGVNLLTGLQIARFEGQPGEIRVVDTQAGVHGPYEVVLCATGRSPNSAGLGLAEIGVALAPDGAVVVDDYSATAVPSVHAIGDVVARQQLTPVALREGDILAHTLFGTRRLRTAGLAAASAVFADPEVAVVGLTEDAARAQGRTVTIYKTRFRPMRQALAGSDEPIFLKLVVDGDTRRVLGAHMVGRDAAEIVQGLAIALEAGATKEHVDATLGIHPTAAEEFVTLRTPS